MSRTPLYLRPASYRRRRRRDTARLLPFVGGFLFLLPMLWTPSHGGLHDTAQDGIYLFLAWAAMIVLGFLISQSLRGDDEGESDDPETDIARETGPVAGPSDTPPPRSD